MRGKKRKRKLVGNREKDRWREKKSEREIK